MQHQVFQLAALLPAVQGYSLAHILVPCTCHEDEDISSWVSQVDGDGLLDCRLNRVLLRTYKMLGVGSSD